jgi:hypothetical protein
MVLLHFGNIRADRRKASLLLPGDYLLRENGFGLVDCGYCLVQYNSKPA